MSLERERACTLPQFILPVAFLERLGGSRATACGFRGATTIPVDPTGPWQFNSFALHSFPNPTSNPLFQVLLLAAICSVGDNLPATSLFLPRKQVAA